MDSKLNNHASHLAPPTPDLEPDPFRIEEVRIIARISDGEPTAT